MQESMLVAVASQYDNIASYSSILITLLDITVVLPILYVEDRTIGNYA